MRIIKYYLPFLEDCKKRGFKEHTLHEYDFYLFKVIPVKIGSKQLSKLKLNDISDIIEAGRLHGNWGPIRSVSVFRRLLHYLDDENIPLPFKWEKIKLPTMPDKDQDFLTEQEFYSFIERIPIDTIYGLRDKALYEIMWTTGLRIGEALALQRVDVDLENNEIKVKTLKGGEGNKVYISDRAKLWLKGYLQNRWDTHPALWIIYGGGIRPLTICQAKHNIIRYKRKFGITKRLNHMIFRRSFATELMNKGANIREVQALCRHRSPRTTLRYYLKYEKSKAKETHQRIFNVFKSNIFRLINNKEELNKKK